LEPTTFRAISQIIVLAGSFAALLGSAGIWYYGNQVDERRPYTQEIRAATATVEVIIDSDLDQNTHYMDKGGFLAFGQAKTALLTDSWGHQLGDNRFRHRGVLTMDISDEAVGKQVKFLADSEYIQIGFRSMPDDATVMSGTATITINNDVQIDVDIPPQQASDGWIIVPDLADVLRDF
jgi:hypothetical protein